MPGGTGAPLLGPRKTPESRSTGARRASERREGSRRARSRSSARLPRRRPSPRRGPRGRRPGRRSGGSVSPWPALRAASVASPRAAPEGRSRGPRERPRGAGANPRAPPNPEPRNFGIAPASPPTSAGIRRVGTEASSGLPRGPDPGWWALRRGPKGPAVAGGGDPGIGNAWWDRSTPFGTQENTGISIHRASERREGSRRARSRSSARLPRRRPSPRRGPRGRRPDRRSGGSVSPWPALRAASVASPRAAPEGRSRGPRERPRGAGANPRAPPNPEPRNFGIAPASPPTSAGIRRVGTEASSGLPRGPDPGSWALRRGPKGPAVAGGGDPGIGNAWWDRSTPFGTQENTGISIHRRAARLRAPRRVPSGSLEELGEAPEATPEPSARSSGASPGSAKRRVGLTLAGPSGRLGRLPSSGARGPVAGSSGAPGRIREHPPIRSPGTLGSLPRRRRRAPGSAGSAPRPRPGSREAPIRVRGPCGEVPKAPP